MACTEVRLDYDDKLREIISKWEDSLEANHDDYEVVDNEESDYGIVRYFGTDLDGNKNVHLMTKYVHGGDNEESFYTLAGAEVVQKLMRANFETSLRRALEESLDPGESQGLYVGWKKDEIEAASIAERDNRKFCDVLIPGYADAFPKEIVNGGVYRFGYRYFVAVVKNPTLGPKESIYFYNIVNPAERLAIKTSEGDGLYKAHHSVWSLGFVRREVVVATTEETNGRTSPLKAPL